MKNYKIAVAGTGYVGLSLSVLLAQHNQVIAVDIVQAKVDMINNHKSPIQDDYIEKYIKKNHIPHPIVYIMACRIGPFAGHFYQEIHKLGGTVYLNPDGHEWMRAKWSAPIRKYWKISEQMMVKYCDLAICDSVNGHKLDFSLHD